MDQSCVVRVNARSPADFKPGETIMKIIARAANLIPTAILPPPPWITCCIALQACGWLFSLARE